MKVIKGMVIIFWGLLIVACGESKVSPDKLTYEQQQQIVDECRKTGKIATDDYCKQVAAVFGPANYRHREQARLAKELAEKPKTTLNMQQ